MSETVVQPHPGNPNPPDDDTGANSERGTLQDGFVALSGNRSRSMSRLVMANTMEKGTCLL